MKIGIKMKKNKDKAILWLIIVLAFLVICEMCGSFLQNHIPLAKEGTCLTVEIGNMTNVKIKIISNDSIKGKSEIDILTSDIFGIMSVSSRTNASYSELKSMMTKKVDCNE
jgi:hypothetical protein